MVPLVRQGVGHHLRPGLVPERALDIAIPQHPVERRHVQIVPDQRDPARHSQAAGEGHHLRFATRRQRHGIKIACRPRAHQQQARVGFGHLPRVRHLIRHHRQRKARSDPLLGGCGRHHRQRRKKQRQDSPAACRDSWSYAPKAHRDSLLEFTHRGQRSREQLHSFPQGRHARSRNLQNAKIHVEFRSPAPVAASMTSYFVRRFLLIVPTFVSVTVLVFVLHAPGARRPHRTDAAGGRDGRRRLHERHVGVRRPWRQHAVRRADRGTEGLLRLRQAGISSPTWSGSARCSCWISARPPGTTTPCGTP